MGAGCGTPAQNGNMSGDLDAAEVERLDAVANRPSKPLRSQLPPCKVKKRWTYAQLLQERKNFWTSRVSGSLHMWNTLEQCAALVLDSNDVGTANAILQASMLSTPVGDLSEVYDETGVRYEVPHYCFQNPVNLVTGLGSSASVRGGNFTSEDIEIKFRLANGSETDDTTCTINTTDTNEKVLKKFCEKSEKAANASRIRLFFYGRELNPKDVCAACGLKKSGFVILALLYT